MFPESYRALKETAALGTVTPRSAIAVAGKDRGAFLQGLLTNDVQSLTAGTGCYSAWLTPQGRMLTDLHVFESGDMMLLDVPAELADAAVQRLEQFLFSEDVQIASLAGALTGVSIHGPAASGILQRVVGIDTADWSEHQNARGDFNGVPVVLAQVSQIGVPGFCIYIEPARAQELTGALEAAGASQADPAAIDVARIEAGYPVFGIDMTAETIPLEAGIEDRAISLSKGCYVGQEVIIRVLHRGKGRVAKKLMALRIDGDAPERGAKVWSADREIGAVTSAGVSPLLGTIALGYLHRDFIAPGAAVEVDAGGRRVPAIVSERPIPRAG